MAKPIQVHPNIEAIERFWRRWPFHDDSIESIDAINTRVVIRLSTLTLVITGAKDLTRCELPAVWLRESITPKQDGFVLEVETDGRHIHVIGADLRLIRNNDLTVIIPNIDGTTHKYK